MKHLRQFEPSILGALVMLSGCLLLLAPLTIGAWLCRKSANGLG